jgi:hypothetical protein
MTENAKKQIDDLARRLLNNSNACSAHRGPIRWSKDMAMAASLLSNMTTALLNIIMLIERANQGEHIHTADILDIATRGISGQRVCLTPGMQLPSWYEEGRRRVTDAARLLIEVSNDRNRLAAALVLMRESIDVMILNMGLPDPNLPLEQEDEDASA